MRCDCRPTLGITFWKAGIAASHLSPGCEKQVTATADVRSFLLQSGDRAVCSVQAMRGNCLPRANPSNLSCIDVWAGSGQGNSAG